MPLGQKEAENVHPLLPVVAQEGGDWRDHVMLGVEHRVAPPHVPRYEPRGVRWEPDVNQDHNTGPHHHAHRRSLVREDGSNRQNSCGR